MRLHRFSKSMRLQKRREFLAIQQSGKKFHGRYFLALVTRGTGHAALQTRPGRVGITVTKKVGNAVIRNRIKRMVREYVRQSEWLCLPVTSVIIAKRSAGELLHYADISMDLSFIQSGIKTRFGPRSPVSAGRPSC